jgi:hypothetical protein
MVNNGCNKLLVQIWKPSVKTFRLIIAPPKQQYHLAELGMLTANQAEVIRYLHSLLIDAEPVGEKKVQIITTSINKNGFLRRYRQVIEASMPAVQAAL